MWKTHRTLLVIAAVVLATAFVPDEYRAGEDVVFSRQVLPVLQAEFAPLLQDEPGLRLDSWEALLAGSEHGQVLIPFDADRSLIVRLAEHASGPERPSDESVALVRRWIDLGAPNDDGTIPFEDSDQLLYACNQGAAVISVIDMETNLVIRTVDLRDFGFSERASPHHVAVSPDGSYWFVSLIGENAVLKFDRKNRLLGRAQFESAGMLALDPEERILFAGRSMTAVNPPTRIGAIDPDAMTVEEIDVFFPRPHALDVSRDGRYVYSASLATDQMVRVDTETFDVRMVDVPGHHHMLMQFAVAPDGATMIVGGEMSGQLLLFDLRDPADPEVRAVLDVGGAPWSPAYSPDSRHAYVPLKRGDLVSVVDVHADEIMGVIAGEGISEPDGVAIRPDGRYLYVTNSNLRGGYSPRYDFGGDAPGTVVVVDTATLEIVRVLEIEHYPTGIATRPVR